MIFWIASYPKSGNTWIRSLLCSYYYTKDGLFTDDVLLKNIGQFPEKSILKNLIIIFQFLVIQQNFGLKRKS